MMKKTNTILVFATTSLLGLGLFLTGCGESEPEASEETPEVSEQSMANTPAQGSEPSAFLLETAPTGAISVAEARKVAEPGESIVVEGQIGAAMNPFGEKFATLVLGDEEIMFCNEMAEDHCATPWDACCEDPEKVATHRASVQLVAGGDPVRGSLRGVGGLSELDHVVVEGSVDPTSTSGNLLINATGVYLQKKTELGN